jgi:tetratricopeptide (TPR) repeat protein
MIIGMMKMKSFLVLVCILLGTGFVSSQQTVDYILKAKAYTESGNPDLAISLLTEAIKLTKDSKLYIQRAEANIIKGNYSGAISDYNEANKITPYSGEYGLSRIYALKGDPATTVYHLEMNLNSPFRKDEKKIMLDPAFGPVENKPEWRQFWKKEWYTASEKIISEIEYYVNTGKIDESKVLLSELKTNNLNDDNIRYAEALIGLSSGKYSEVTGIVSGLLAADPENEEYLRILAKAQTGASNPSGASVTYGMMLNLCIADADLLIHRAECYRKTGETDKALTDIRKYLELYPENKTAISLAGKVEAASGDNLKALEYFSKNLDLHPNDADCYIDRANSYFISKSWDWAIKDFSMSLDLKPDNSDAWLNKGIALLSSGRLDDACHDFRKSMSLGNKRASEYINNCIR